MIFLAYALQVAATVIPGDSALQQIHSYVRISERLATSGQMTSEQIEDIALAGFEVVVNLAPAREERNGREGYLMAVQGITYVNIPVDWEEPKLRDLDMFFAVMNANRDRKVYVHCFANMRASAFTYLYRVLDRGETESEARGDMEVIWDPASQRQWGEFVAAARARAARRPQPN